MNGAVYELGNHYLKNHNGFDYTKEELHDMLNLNFDDYTFITDFRTNRKIRMREWLIFHADQVESGIDKLYQNFGRDLPIELSEILEQILFSQYHTLLIRYAKTNAAMVFSECKDEIIADYWDLRKKLEETKKKTLL